MQVGDYFNPYKLFNGIIIPEALVPWRGISLGAKMLYGRLARYAGKNGKCYPTVPTLAAALGCSVRSIQLYMSELKDVGLVKQEERLRENNTHTSSSYRFVWHYIFDSTGDDDLDGEESCTTKPQHGEESCTTKRRILHHQTKNPAPLEESHLKENHFKIKPSGLLAAPGKTNSQKNSQEEKGENSVEISGAACLTNLGKKKPADGRLACYWKDRMSTVYPQWVEDLTRKEERQLKKLNDTLGPITREVITYAINNWLKFGEKCCLVGGFYKYPGTPNIGFLLMNQHVAKAMLQSIATIIPAEPVEITPPEQHPAPPAKLIQANPSKPKTDVYKPSLEEVVALMAKAGIKTHIENGKVVKDVKDA